MRDLIQMIMTKKYSKSKKNVTFTQKVLNNVFVLFLAGVMLFGLKCYSANRDSLTFAQISDVHYSSAKINTGYRLKAESGELLQDAIEQVNMTPDIDFVMFTGDMIDTPYQRQLMKFITYANTLNAPWYAVFGNHDNCIGGNLNKKLYLDILNAHNKNFHFVKPYYSFEPKKGYKVIALDSIIDNRITANGRLSGDELKWLDKELSKSKDDTVLIFIHGPLVEPFHSSTHYTLNADEALKIIYKYKNPIAVFSGHYHTTKIKQVGNVLHVSTPALVSYPNAFRIVRVNNEKDKAVFDIYFKETRLKDVQNRAKMMVFGSNTYYGAPSDRTATYILKRK